MTRTLWEYIRCWLGDTKSYDIEDINLKKELNFKKYIEIKQEAKYTDIQY